jgi:hypothetical protein
VGKRTWKLRTRPDAAAVIAESGSLREAARRLGMNVSTLSRAVKAGRLPAPTRGSGPIRRPAALAPVAPVAPPDEAAPPRTFQEWALATFELTEAERALVAMAQAARDLAHDPAQPATTQLSAMAQFRACLKDLRLPTEDAQYGHVQAFPALARRA